MGNGQRPDLDGFVALVQWLGAQAEEFMVWPDERPRDEQPSLESQLALLLRARDDLDEADREYLLDIVRATMRRIKADRRGV